MIRFTFSTPVLLVLLVGCGTGASVTRDSTRAAPGATITRHSLTDPQVTACIGDSVSTTVTRDYEPHAAVDPRDRQHAVVVWMTLGRPASTASVSVTTDGGATWSPPHSLPFNACAGGAADATRTSDPWTSIGPEGQAYVAALAFTDSSGVDKLSSIVVFASPNGGETWGPRVVAVPSTVPTFLYDNVAVTADPTRPGTIYLTTTQYQNATPGAGPAAFARSTDGGATWSEIRALSPVVRGERTSAPVTVVDPRTGRVYLIYFRENGPEASLAMMRSDDAGLTWSSQRTIAPFVRLTKYPSTRIRLGDIHPIVTAQDIIHGVVDSASGRLFVAFADARHTDGAHLQISVTWSSDGGDRWEPPVRVSPSMAAHAWLPSIAISRERVLGVSYLDTRDWTEGSSGPVPTRVSLTTYRLAADGSLAMLSERQLDRFNLLGSGKQSFGTGDYQALIGLAEGFGAVYVRPNCAATATSCPDSGKPRTDVVMVR